MAKFFSNLLSGKKNRSYKISEIYSGLRKQILDLSKKDQIKLKEHGATDRIAIMMETGLEDDCYTLAAVSDGSASLYFSNGGGILGAGETPQGSNSAKTFLTFSMQFDNQLTEASEYPLPMPGMVRFYIIKAGSVLSGVFKEDDLGNQRSPLSPLFLKGHELIATIRFIEETRKTESPLIASIILDNSADSVRDILKSGIDPNISDSKGVPAIAIAVSRQQEEIVDLLLAAGANPNINISDKEKKIINSPLLIFAAANGNLSIVNKLIAAGVNSEEADASGLTPLMAAAFMGHNEIVEYLIGSGSKLEQKDTSGYTALIFASNSGHLKCVEVLLNNGADANAKDHDESTPIMFAAQHGYNEIVKLLLSKGADPLFTGSHGLSAIGFAQQNSRKETEDILNQKLK